MYGLILEMTVREWSALADIPPELLDRFYSEYLDNYNRHITEVNQPYNEWWIDFNLLLPCI